MNDGQGRHLNESKPCLTLEIHDADGKIKTTFECGYEEENPLELIEGSHRVLLRLGADFPPYRYPQSLHPDTSTIGNPENKFIPIFPSGEYHDIVMVFKSDDMPEKEPRCYVKTLDEDTLDLGTHKLLPGALELLLVAELDLDFITADEALDDDESIIVGGRINMNLTFWFRVVRKAASVVEQTQ